MALSWWDWKVPKERLSMWLKAILGGRRYRVEFDLDFASPGAIGAESNRLLILNPTHWDESGYANWHKQRLNLHSIPFTIRDWATWSWLCCKAVGAHEVGHARFTGTPPGNGLLPRIVNILEDERIESGMIDRYPILAPYFDLVGDAQWSNLDSTPASLAGSPHSVIHACLLWRWEHDLPLLAERGLSKISLTTEMAALWEIVRPLTEQAWCAAEYEEVVEIAEQIMSILSLPKDQPSNDLPDWLKELLDMLELVGADGEPTPCRGDERLDDSKSSAGLPGSDPGPDKDGRRKPSIDDTPDVPDSNNPTGGIIKPQPFAEIETKVTPWVQQLVAELAVPAPDVEPEPAQYGGRLTLRQAMRDPARPFMAPQGVGHSSEGLAIEVLGDRSGSMGWKDEPKMQAAQQGVMTLHLACLQLGIPHAISLFDDEVILKDYEHQGELTKALIAGWDGETDEEHIDVLMNLRGKRLLQRPERTKVMLIVHDGRPVIHGEVDRIKEWIAKTPQVLVIGIYLSTDLESDWSQRETARMAAIFPHFVTAEPATLPAKLGSILRSLYRTGGLAATGTD